MKVVVVDSSARISYMLDNRWFRNIRRHVSTYSPLKLGVVFGLIVPMALMVLVLRVVRIIERGTELGLLSVLDLLKGDLFLVAGLGFLAVAVLRVFRGRRRRRVAVVGLQLTFMFVASLELIGHNFYMATGSSIDYTLIAHSINTIEVAWEVISSEVPVGFVVLSSVAAAGVVGLPWGISWWGRVADDSRDPEADEQRGGERDGMKSGGMLVLGGLLLAASWLPAFAVDNTAFARPATANILESALGSSAAAASDVEAADYDAKQARLEPTEKSSDDQRRNLVFITLESTRARSTSFYNDQRKTTPNLAELAKKSVVAEQAFAVVPHTSKALIAMHCGIEPRLSMPITESRPDGIPAECMADLLKKRGYETAFFQSAKRAFNGEPVEGRAQLVDNFGFEDFYSVENMDTSGFERANYFGYEDDVMLEPSKEWLKNHRDSPFYVSYLTLTPHHQYLAPQRYGRHDYAHKKMLNRYINAVHYVDQFVRNLINQYKELGLYEETVFVIAGDHGEGFNEHGRSQHDNVIWQEGLRVPLLVHDPQRVDQARRIEEPVNLLDMVPTAADLLGYSIEGANLPGKSILNVDETRTFYAHCWYERRCMARIEWPFKYIYHFGNRKPEFYNLEKDPREKDNIIGQRSDVGAWRRDLKRWRSSILEMYREYSRQDVEEFVYHQRPEVEHEVDIRYGDLVRLVGYDLSKDKPRPGESVTVTYYYEVLGKLAPKWKLFVHGEGGKKMLNLDHKPNKGLYPMSDWKVGEYVADKHQFAIPKNFSGDQLVLYVGIYSGKDGRLPVKGAERTKGGSNRPRVVEIPVADE